MTLQIIFKILNPHFDAKYAKEFNDKKESDGNRKDKWSRRQVVDGGIDNISIIESGEYNLSGKFRDGAEFNFLIPNMRILECYSNNAIVARFAVSNILIESTRKVHNPKDNTTRFYFYLNEKSDFSECGTNALISKESIPYKLQKPLS